MREHAEHSLDLLVALLDALRAQRTRAALRRADLTPPAGAIFLNHPEAVAAQDAGVRGAEETRLVRDQLLR